MNKAMTIFGAIIILLLATIGCGGSKSKSDKKDIEGKKDSVDVAKPIIEWVSIPAGTFTMGSPSTEVGRFDYETQHQVTLSAFKISKYEITFEQYDAFCEATDRVKPKDNSYGRGKHPVINVSWFDANNFALWMGCRLPTHAEFEYANRAGTTTPFNTGDNITADQANYNGEYSYNDNERGVNRKQTMPVGSFAPNAFGLYDMHGNVSEWCNDWFGDISADPQTNPNGAAMGSYRVYCGGSFFDIAQNCRSACFSRSDPNYSYYNLGFRLVLIDSDTENVSEK